MDFLYCNPNVLVVKDRYEIVVNTNVEGVCYVKVGRKTYHENASGIMPSVTLVHKFAIPQKALDEKKGRAISAIEITDLTTLADYFVLCTAGSTTQVKALCDICEEEVEKAGGELHHREGFRDGGWVLLDFSDVVVHVFLEDI